MADDDREAASLRLDTRTVSFCTEMSGHDDLWAIGRGDQGLIFFTPNQTWSQPPVYAHTMVKATWEPLVVNLTAPTSLDVVAARSQNGSTGTVRVINTDERNAVTASLSIKGLGAAQSAKVTTLTGPPDAVNPATDPSKIVPTVREESFVSGKDFVFPPYSFTTIALSSL